MKIKVHETYRQVVAICDSSLLGKEFEEGKKILKVKEPFFGGKDIEKKELKEKIKHFSREDSTFNIVGKNSIETALETGVIKKEGVQKIEDVPYALVLL